MNLLIFLFHLWNNSISTNYADTNCNNNNNNNNKEGKLNYCCF